MFYCNIIYSIYSENRDIHNKKENVGVSDLKAYSFTSEFLK